MEEDIWWDMVEVVGFGLDGEGWILGGYSPSASMLPHHSTYFDSDHQHLPVFSNPEKFPVLFLQIFQHFPVSGF